MDEQIKQVDVSTLQERVYLEMRKALYQGRFTPGTPLTIRSLATALGTSPMPVREAIQRLVAERALVQMSNRTIRVPAVTAEIFEELTRIRMVIEGYAAQRAARRSTPELCARLRAINAELRDAIAADDAAKMLARNHSFHFMLYRAALSGELLQIIESLWLRYGPILAFVRNLPGSNARFQRDTDVHERIVDALERRDARAARFALALGTRASAVWFRHEYDFESPPPWPPA
jgi:DNA-binding GntR family transcriptional regulator